MDWTAAAATADIVAAIGVILSLIYLSRQIRSSTRAAREAAAQEVLSGNRVLLGQIGRDPATAGVWRRGMMADPSLTEDELAQFHALLLQLIYDWMRIFHLDLAGGLEPWVLEGSLATRREIVGSPGFRRWYPERKHWLSGEFRVALEEDMKDPGRYNPLLTGMKAKQKEYPDELSN